MNAVDAIYNLECLAVDVIHGKVVSMKRRSEMALRLAAVPSVECQKAAMILTDVIATGQESTCLSLSE